MSSKTSRALFETRIRLSGLTPSDAGKLQLQPLPRVPTQLQSTDSRPCIRIPYHDVEGKPTGFYRVRFLGDPEPPAVKGFESAVSKLDRAAGINGRKVLRYLQPRLSGVHAYFPRLFPQWAQLVVDPAKTLYITEGEFKAACATKHGFPCIGLGGVNSWSNNNEGLELIRQLEAVEWKQREVFIVFDSDIATKNQVLWALHRFCETLTRRGAIPRIVKLPSDDGEKCGLDDYLVALGPDAFKVLLNEAETFGTARALWSMNKKVCFVRDPGIVVELRTGRYMSVSMFTKDVYVNEHHNETQVTGNGGIRLIRKKTAQSWIEWASRNEVERMIYAPGQPKFIDGNLNTWRPSGIEPKKGNVKPWVELLDYAFAGEPESRAWFEQWCAYPLQHPGVKLLTAVAIWGVHQGTGKTLVGYSLARLYGEHNVSEISQRHLHAPFNEWLVDRQLILGDEITGQSDRRSESDQIKSLITQDTVRVNMKYIREYNMPAIANFFFTSNHPESFYLEDTDRRFFIHEIVAPPKSHEFYDRYDRWFRSDEGAGALLDHLLRIDIRSFNPNAPALHTRAKRDMIDDNKSDLSAWVLRLKQDPRAVLDECGIPVKATVLSPSQLLAMYDPSQMKRITLNALGREMKRAQFKRVPCNVKLKSVWTSINLYVVQDFARLILMTAPEVGREWSAFFKRL